MGKYSKTILKFSRYFELMKIAYIILKGMPLGGGIEKYTEELGTRLAMKEHEIIVYTMRNYGTKDGEYKKMKIKTVPTLKTRSFEKIIASFIATLRHCISDKVEIVHFHAFGPAMFCIVPKLLKRKVVVQGHGLEWKRSKWSPVIKFFLKLSEIPSVKFPHIVTVVSKVQQKYLKEKYGIESVYIPPGVNPPKIEKPNIIKQYGLNGNDYILFAARLVKEKGAHYLIQAYNRLKPNLKLVIAGDALYEERYKNELYKLAENNRNIIFPGFVQGKLKDELFSNAYLFVAPSELEGLSISVLEAMSYGNCCLVSDIPENLEAINKFGYSFRNKEVNDLIEKLSLLIKNENKVYEMKTKAKDYVLKNFSWDSIANQWEILYRKLLEGSK
ncbi:MAG: glycosyltransferase family 4 protein [Promethearchaeota archaeon]